MPGVVLQNCAILDPEDGELRPGSAVRIEGDRIVEVEGHPIAHRAEREIDCGGRVLMPGLIDAHVHLFMETIPIPVAMAADPNYVAIRAGIGAEAMLLRGFTSVRDLAGPVFGLKRAIDEGLVAGPRISAVFVASTSTVFRRSGVVPPWLAYFGYAVAAAMFFVPLVTSPLGVGLPLFVLVASVTILVSRTASEGDRTST